MLSSLANPVWGYFADRTGKRKLVLFILCLGSVAWVVPQPWIAKCLQNHHNTHVNVTDDASDDVAARGYYLSKEVTNNRLYYSLLTISSVSAIFIIPLPGYLDTIGVNVIKNCQTPATYGAQRIFGDVGFSIANYVAGMASDHYQESGMSQYTPVFYMLLLHLLLTIPIGYHLINQGTCEQPTPAPQPHEATEATTTDKEAEAEASNASPTLSVRMMLWKMMKNPDIVFFLCTVIISGVAWNTYNFFTLLLVNHVVPNTKAKMSLALVLGSVSNVVMFPASSTLIRFLGGPSQGIILALVAYFIRYIIMSYTNVFGVMVGVQLMHGVCFALSWASMIEHVHKIAPKEIVLTVFMMLSSIHFGVCGLIANIVGGTVFHVYGGRALFGAVAVLCAIWALVMIVYCTFKYCTRRSSATSSNFEGKDKCVEKMERTMNSSDTNMKETTRCTSGERKSQQCNGIQNIALDFEI